MLGILKLADPNKKKYHLIIFIDLAEQFYHKNVRYYLLHY